MEDLITLGRLTVSLPDRVYVLDKIGDTVSLWFYPDAGVGRRLSHYTGSGGVLWAERLMPTLNLRTPKQARRLKMNQWTILTHDGRVLGCRTLEGQTGPDQAIARFRAKHPGQELDETTLESH